MEHRRFLRRLKKAEIDIEDLGVFVTRTSTEKRQAHARAWLKILGLEESWANIAQVMKSGFPWKKQKARETGLAVKDFEVKPEVANRLREIENSWQKDLELRRLRDRDEYVAQLQQSAEASFREAVTAKKQDPNRFKGALIRLKSLYPESPLLHEYSLARAEVRGQQDSNVQESG